MNKNLYNISSWGQIVFLKKVRPFIALFIFLFKFRIILYFFRYFFQIELHLWRSISLKISHTSKGREVNLQTIIPFLQDKKRKVWTFALIVLVALIDIQSIFFCLQDVVHRKIFQEIWVQHKKNSIVFPLFVFWSVWPFFRNFVPSFIVITPFACILCFLDISMRISQFDQLYFFLLLFVPSPYLKCFQKGICVLTHNSNPRVLSLEFPRPRDHWPFIFSFWSLE